VELRRAIYSGSEEFDEIFRDVLREENF